MSEAGGDPLAQLLASIAAVRDVMQKSRPDFFSELGKMRSAILEMMRTAQGDVAGRMAEEPEKLVHGSLRNIDRKIDRLLDDVHDLKLRVTSVEEGLARVSRRLDRLDGRMDRRLDLVESPRDTLL